MILKKLTLFSSLIVLCGAVAGAPSRAADLRIGVVNPIKVLKAAPQAEEARKRLEREFASRDKNLVAAQRRAKQLEDRLAKDAPVMTETERRKIERDIIGVKRDLKRDQDEFREDLNFRRNEEFGKIQRQVVEAIQNLAKEEGFDVIVGEGVIYANERVDVTSKVVERLKKGYRGK
ncbi:MAG: OmpH family outer membrane protein [Gammaproteobacteria bacterium]